MNLMVDIIAKKCYIAIDMNTVALKLQYEVKNLKKTTIEDIAKILNISKSTVSRALNNKKGVNEALRRRIFETAQDLNYTFNQGASSLRTGKTGVIGVIISDVSNTFFSKVIYGIESILYDSGYNIILVNTDENPSRERSQLETLVSKRVEGIISSPSAGTENVYRNLIRHGMPVVFFDRKFGRINADYVVVDNRDAVLQAVQYLYNKNHRKICFVAGDINIYTGKERMLGFKRAIKLFGIPEKDCPIVYGNFRKMEAYKVTRKIIQKGRISAIIASSNKTTLGVIKAVLDSKLSIPSDICVVGFDEQEYSDLFLHIPIIVQPEFSIGSIAAEILLSKLNGKKPIVNKQQEVILKCKMINVE